MDISDMQFKLTRQGYEDLQSELDEILKVKRPAIVERIREAKALGDLKENFDYHDAKRQQGLLESRIQELKAILNNIIVVDPSENNGCVCMGAKVIIRDVEDDFEETYMIVGPPEADPSNGKISYESSIGSALMGCKAGDNVCVQTPGGELKYVIISVE